MARTHCIHELIALFDATFRDSHGTVLVRGEHEPVYLPAGDGAPYHRIVFAHGYFASALHEIAHWTVAGAARRLLEDFGYWYKPDGRTRAEQRLFEQVEVKPQALEWLYATAAGFPFRFSSDNLNGDTGDTGPFQAAVHAQVTAWLTDGLPNRRARRWVAALAGQYGTPPLHPAQFPAPADAVGAVGAV